VKLGVTSQAVQAQVKLEMWYSKGRRSWCTNTRRAVQVEVYSCLAGLNQEAGHSDNRCSSDINCAADMKPAARAKLMQHFHKAKRSCSKQAFRHAASLTGFSVSVVYPSWPAVSLWLEQSAASIAHLLCSSRTASAELSSSHIADPSCLSCWPACTVHTIW